MLVFCQAWEGMYQGLHGIESIAVIEVSDDMAEAEKEINEWGDEESHELIYSYGLESEYLEELEDYDEDDYNLEDCPSYSDRGWRAWKIRDDITLSARELDNKCNSLGEKIFVDEYCEEDTLF